MTNMKQRISRLKYVRFTRRLSQDELSRLTGINRATISRLENGYISGTEKERKLLAEALDVRPEMLFSQKGDIRE
jgi:transcriptional regulator with XRE-family HTH domain